MNTGSKQTNSDFSKKRLRPKAAEAQAKSEARLERQTSATLQSWKSVEEGQAKQLKRRVFVDLGSGTLFFAHTYDSHKKLVTQLIKENEEKRNIAIYVRDPHVILSEAPQEVFLDPSHTFRIWLNNYRARKDSTGQLLVRRLVHRSDIDAVRRIYAQRKMVVPDGDYLWKNRNSRKIVPLVVEAVSSGEVIGAVMGVDHVQVFEDPEGGSSLWSLAVDPQAKLPGAGEALTRFLCEYFMARGRAFMDLSVMHDNEQAIKLYEKLGFERVPVFTVKRKNPINEALFSAPLPEESLNPYALIIVNEARRRGIRVEVLDKEAAYFSLTHGGRTINCRESLTDLTSAVTMSVVDDKSLTRKWLKAANLSVPAQRKVGIESENLAFLELHKRVVIKPARGEQGKGITVDVRGEESLKRAIAAAKRVSSDVLLEQYVEGQDLRIIVINYKFVAAAIRMPAEITGDGKFTIKELIKKQSRRRAAATGGESSIPLDAETERCVIHAGYSLDSVLEQGKTLQVRKTANLHTGGTMQDVTAAVSPALKAAAEEAARTLSIPVTGLDFLVPDVSGDTYWIIEANERPGLENHQPQPTAERFIDLLFPETAIQG